MASSKVKESKNQRRRAAKKSKKAEGAQDAQDTSKVAEAKPEVTEKREASLTPSITLDISEDDSLYSQFKDVLGKFQEGDDDAAVAALDKPEVFYEDDDIPDEEDEKQRMSRKQRKMQSRLSVAELKALVRKPELVEADDNASGDPILLLAIKAHRNVVPVPAHWALKREYLSSKRGIEKPPFSLPKFIADTGIGEMRDAVLEKRAEMTLKQKQRERVQPKMGKLDVDYQKLYEAFFKFQTKPELTRYGEVYYEGKEFETNLKHLRPGELSDELKAALSIPPGAPPPWLINQQRYGPPPSYPALKIPGLNAPLPPGADWGYHPGGYGKPPVDEYNRPLYGGDLIGILQPQQNQQLGEPVEKTLWGELEVVEDESEEEEDEDEEESEEEPEEEDVGAGLQTPGGLETPGGLHSTMPSEFGGADGSEFTLRKRKRGTEAEDASQPRSAYQVLPEQAVHSQGFFGSEKIYDLKAARQQPTLDQDDGDRRSRRRVGDVDVSVDVDALEREDRLSREEVARQYEASRQQAASSNPWSRNDEDDLSQMIADESRKRLKKEEEKRSRR